MRTLHLMSLSLLVAFTASAATVQLSATLDGGQETPPVMTAATGTASFTLDLTANQLTYSVTPTGLGQVIAAHLHRGDVGVAGAPVITLDASSLSGTVADVSPAQQADLLGGHLYVNLHTGAQPLGEIRGQVTIAAVEGTTCSCTDAATPGAFKSCVKKAIAKLAKADKASAPIKALKAAVKKASCGKTKGPKKAIGCCLAQTPAGNIVVDHLCAALPAKACGKLAGAIPQDSCFDTTPCSPSGAFVD